MPTLTLYDIGQQFDALEQLLEEAGGEWSPEAEAWIAEYGLAEREKVDGYAFYLKGLEQRAAAAKALADELAAKSKTLLNRKAALLARIEGYMTDRGVDRVEGSIYKFQYEKHGGKLPLVLTVDDPAQYPSECCTTQVVLDKDTVRTWAETGDARLVGLAHIGERGRSVRVR